MRLGRWSYRAKGPSFCSRRLCQRSGRGRFWNRSVQSQTKSEKRRTIVRSAGRISCRILNSRHSGCSPLRLWRWERLTWFVASLNCRITLYWEQPRILQNPFSKISFGETFHLWDVGPFLVSYRSETSLWIYKLLLYSFGRSTRCLASSAASSRASL